MAGINKVILVGNLGRDPEVKTLEGGVKVARFTVATTESYKDRTTGERKDATEWHNVVCWRNLADIAEKYLVKGKQVYVEGRLRTRSWDENGTKRYVTEVYADNFQMLGKVEGGMDHAAPAAPQNSMQQSEIPSYVSSPDGDELPF